jgi:hypothetical protein
MRNNNIILSCEVWHINPYQEESELIYECKCKNNDKLYVKDCESVNLF